MINVTKTFFPPIKEYNAQVQKIWENQWLTNRGALVLELEEKLKEKNVLIKNNKTAQYLMSRGFEADLVWDVLKEFKK